MKNQASRPIGMLDSGIGGLTVAYAIKQLLPNESIVYFGDTAHFPYGEKDTSHLQKRIHTIAQQFIEKDCKLIITACHTASAATYNTLKEIKGIPVFNVLDPLINHLDANFKNRTVGLIGTNYTIHSNIYEKKLNALGSNIQLKSLATPLLAPIVEEGLDSNESVSLPIIQRYLSQPQLQNIDALLLGCTHYSVLRPVILHFYQGSTALIDAALLTAQAVKSYLESKKLLHQDASQDCFIATQEDLAFINTVKLWFGQSVQISQL